MSKLIYTKNEIDFIKSQIYFNEEEIKVLDMWLLDKSIVETSIKLNISTATVSRRRKVIQSKINNLKDQIYKNKMFLILN